MSGMVAGARYLRHVRMAAAHAICGMSGLPQRTPSAADPDVLSLRARVRPSRQSLREDVAPEIDGHCQQHDPCGDHADPDSKHR